MSMNTWTPLWSQVVESTLWEEPLPVRVLFLTMLAIKEPDHVVRMPFRRLCKKANMEPEVVSGALKVLEEPDTLSVDHQPFGGRRVQEVEGGWLILNGEHYRQAMSKLMLRLRKNEWQKADRAKKKLESGSLNSGTPLAGEGAYVAAERRGDLAECDRLTAPKLNQEQANARAVAEARAAVGENGGD